MSLYILLLSIAIGFSAKGCMPAFASRPDMAPKQLAQTVLATSISISALALAFSAQNLLLGALVVALGLAIAAVSEMRTQPTIMLAIAAGALALYLQGMQA